MSARAVLDLGYFFPNHWKRKGNTSHTSSSFCWDQYEVRSLNRVLPFQGGRAVEYRGCKACFVARLPTTYLGSPWRSMKRARLMRAAAFGKEVEGEKEESKFDPGLELGIPYDQRPVNELTALKDVPLYSWATLALPGYAGRLTVLGVAIFLFLGGPIAAGSFEPLSEPVPFLLAGGVGALFGVSVIVLRMYLGWSYVYNRLLSAVVAYEETGWYDGQLWVKPPEVLARDRLLGSYQVKPVILRLQRTLAGAGVSLVGALISLALIGQSQPSMSDGYITGDTFAKKVSFRLQDLLNLPDEVLHDDDVATAAAEAANGRPVYCRDRYYRALAGGQYCKWEDLRK